jgi:hypothetical protein
VSEVENDGVETEADFAQLVESTGVMDWLLDKAPGEDVPHDAPADTGTAERPRDDKGRFISDKEDDEQPEEPQEPVVPEDDATESVAPEDDEIVIELDDDLAAVLERYDGDIGKALRSLQDKESFTGRQANEIGQLRADLAAMRQMMEQQPQQQPQQYFGPYQNDLDENPKGLVAEALERGDQRTLELAIRAWGDEEPFEAAAFLFALNNQQSQQQAPVEQPTPSREAGLSIEEAMASVVQRHPDVEKHLPALGEVAKEFPTLRNFMESGTPAQQAQAFEELLVIAKTRSSTADTSHAMKRVILRTQEEVRKEKADAQVVSAQTQSAATPQEDRLEQFYKAFEEASGQVEDEHWIHRT